MNFTKPCGCVIMYDPREIPDVIYCPKHRIAFELYEALEAVLFIGTQEAKSKALETLGKVKEWNDKTNRHL